MRAKKKVSYHTESGEEGWSTELSSLSDASSGDDWVPPMTERERAQKTTKSIRSGLIRPVSSSDNDDSSDSSPVTSSPQNKPNTSTTASKPIKRKAINDGNGHNSKQLVNKKSKNEGSNIKQIKKPDEQKCGLKNERVKQTKSNRSGKERQISSSDDDDCSDSSSTILSSKSERKISTSSASKTTKRESINDGNSRISRWVVNENSKNKQIKKPDEKESALIVATNPVDKKPDEPKKKLNQPSEKSKKCKVSKNPVDKKLDEPKKVLNQPTEMSKKCKPGDFLILNSDLTKPNHEHNLWKVDGKSLLQRYDHVIEDDGVVYKQTYSFVGYQESTLNSYRPVKILNVKFNYGEHVVRLTDDEIKSLEQTTEK